MCNACTVPCAICSLSPEAKAALKAQLLKNLQDDLAGFSEEYLAELDRKVAQFRVRERLRHCPPESRTLAMYEAAGEEPDWDDWEEPPRRRRLRRPSAQLAPEFPEVIAAE
ncbi:MAG TPA: hypothetical protein VE993_19290 [Stellaceae bacterium]|nr:hypothetical protein [Stellaceae bacterium]